MTWQALFENPRSVMPRESYLPPFMRDVPPLTPLGTDLFIWTWEERGKILGIAFQGKSNKPLWFNSFRTTDDRLGKIRAAIASRKSSLGAKATRAEARRSFRHSLRVGDILYASWGYEQTNVDFYKVVALKGKSNVLIQQIGKTVESSKGAGIEYVVPAFVAHPGPTMSKRVSEGNCVRLSSYSSACLWDGKPKYETASGWGHG